MCSSLCEVECYLSASCSSSINNNNKCLLCVAVMSVCRCFNTGLLLESKSQRLEGEASRKRECVVVQYVTEYPIHVSYLYVWWVYGVCACMCVFPVSGDALLGTVRTRLGSSLNTRPICWGVHISYLCMMFWSHTHTHQTQCQYISLLFICPFLCVCGCVCVYVAELVSTTSPPGHISWWHLGRIISWTYTRVRPGALTPLLGYCALLLC